MKEYAKVNNLDNPKYTSSSHIDKGKVVAYFSKVQIGDKSWLVCPISYRTPEGADNAVAKKALDQLKAHNLSDVECFEQTENVVLTERIIQIFKQEDENNTSIFSTQIEELFLRKYNQKLNENWIDVIETTNVFEVERLKAGTKLLITVALTADYLNGKLKLAPDDGSEKKKNENIENLMGQVADLDLVSTSDDQELPEELELSKDEDWQILVLRTTSSNQLVVRLTNNTDKLDELISKLNKFYNERKLGVNVDKIILKKIYAAVFDGAVFRVEALLLEGDQVHCWFLDDGINEKISKLNLREMDNEFMKFPFQAFTVHLDGLENESESLIRRFVDNKRQEHDDAFCLIARPTCYEPITVKLFDTTNEETDIVLNQEIKSYIDKQTQIPFNNLSIATSCLPEQLDENDQSVIVSMTVNPHNFIVRDSCVLNNEFRKLNDELQQFYSMESERIELNSSMIYSGLFVCVEENGKWFRARVHESLSAGASDLNDEDFKCTCYLIDIGKMVICKLLQLQPLYSQFCQLPMLANKATLSNVLPMEEGWSVETVIHFKELVDQQELNACLTDIITIDNEAFILLDLKDQNGASISDELIKCKRAKRF